MTPVALINISKIELKENSLGYFSLYMASFLAEGRHYFLPGTERPENSDDSFYKTD